MAHLALSLQPRGDSKAVSLNYLVQAASNISLPCMQLVLSLVMRLKDFIRGDTWLSLGTVLRESCNRVAL